MQKYETKEASIIESLLSDVISNEGLYEGTTTANLTCAGDLNFARFADLNRNLSTMNATRLNYAYRQLYSVRRVIGKAIVFVKKAIRKCLKWYIEPICFQQTDFNNATTNAVDRLRELEESNCNRIGEINAQLYGVKEELNARIRQLIEQQNAIETNFKRFRIEMDKLHEQGAFDYSVQDVSSIRRSASQSGEDGIISHVLRALGIPEKDCSYLDLGANHAKLLSNTYYFYQLGARGVLVEANPKLIGELRLYRSGDIIINRCISTKSGQTIPFYVLSGDGLSTPDKEEAEAAILQNKELYISNVEEILTITVNELMEKYFTKAPMFLNIDIEGDELEILKSIDWTIHRPLAISVEVIPYRTHLVIGEKRHDIGEYMAEQDYVEYAFTGINSIFLDRHQLSEVLNEHSF